jgi:hypothetical protein
MNLWPEEKGIRNAWLHGENVAHEKFVEVRAAIERILRGRAPQGSVINREDS